MTLAKVRAGLFAMASAGLLGTAAHADTSSLQIYGPGNASCATYLQDRSLRINADGWILGYWTGLNTASEDHLVGKSTDSRGHRGPGRDHLPFAACRPALQDDQAGL